MRTSAAPGFLPVLGPVALVLLLLATTNGGVPAAVATGSSLDSVGHATSVRHTPASASTGLGGASSSSWSGLAREAGTSCGGALRTSSLCTPPRAMGVLASPAVPTWANATPNIAPTVPLASIGSSAAYDPLLGGTVYFGGCASHACPNAQTWLYASGSWRNLTSTAGSAPPARTNASFVYYPPGAELVLFGGLGAGNKQLQDTWLFANGTWSLWTLTPAHPPARWAAGMTAYNNSTVTLVLLFGGCGGYPCGGLLADTWSWNDIVGWVQIRPPTSPSPRGGVALAMDAADGYAVLFGGCTYSNTAGWACAGGYWTFQDAIWTSHGAGAPPARGFASLTDDLSTGELLLFGGVNGTGDYSDTWTFHGGNWSPLTPTVHPSARADAASPPASPVPVVVGGSCGKACGPDVDTWVFEVPPAPNGSVSPGVTDVGFPVSFNASVTGGTAPYRFSWDFGDGSTGALSAGSHTYGSSGNYSVSLTVVDSMGVSATASAAVTVHALPALEFRASPTAGDLGLSANWSVATTQSGTAPDHVDWSFGDGTNATGLNVTHSYDRVGAFTLVATITDSIGGWTNISAPYLVNPVLSVAVSTVPALPYAGQSVVFFAGTSGGTTPISVQWNFGDNGTSNLTTPSHVYATPGNWTVTATVLDGAGARVISTYVVMVGNPPPPAPPSPSPPLSPWLEFGILTSVIAIGLAIPSLWLHYRRKRRRAPGDPADEDPWLTARRRVRRLRK